MSGQCPSRPDLKSLLQGGMPTPRRRQIEQHIAGCLSCQTTLDSLTQPPTPIPAAETTSSAKLAAAINTLKQSNSRSTPGAKKTSPKTLPAVPSAPVLADPGRKMTPVEQSPLSSPQPNSTCLIGRYQIVRKIGSGACGRVYEGFDPKLERTVAIKVLSDQSDSPESRERLLREARAIVHLDHRGIVRIFDIIELPGQPPAIVMEFIQGGSIAELAQNQELTPQRSARLVAQAAKGLAYAHDHNLIHRDIKPSNLLIEPDSALEESKSDIDRVCLADFGLVSILDDDSHLTRTGELAGTPAYMSPEQIENPSSVGVHSDTYSLGCVLYELLTGRTPFEGTIRMVLWQVMHDYPKPPSLLDDRIPKQLEAICLKCLEKKPDHRYATAQQLADDLDRFLSGESVIAKPPGPMTHAARLLRKHPFTLTIITVISLSVLCIATVATYYAIHLRNAQNQIELQAIKAGQGRDVALEALESLVFDAYDKLDRSDFDPDEVQIELLKSAAASLERIEVSEGQTDTLHNRIESHARIARAMWRIDQLQNAHRQIQKANKLLASYPTALRNTQRVRTLRLQVLATFLDVQFELGDRRGFETTLAEAQTVLSDLAADQQLDTPIHALAADVQLSHAIERISDGLDARAQLAAALASHQHLGSITRLEYADALRRLGIVQQLAEQELAESKPNAARRFDRLAALCNVLIEKDTSAGYLPDVAILEYRMHAQVGLIVAESGSDSSAPTGNRFEVGWNILQDFMQYDADIVGSDVAWQLVQLAQSAEAVSKVIWTQRAIELADWEARALGTIDRQVYWRRVLLPLLKHEGLEVEWERIVSEIQNLGEPLSGE